MKSLLVLSCVVLAACGSLDNDPLRVGVLRGQLVGADQAALVAVMGREDLVARPDATGRFELLAVPLGTVDLLVVINARESRRLSVEVGPAAIVELGVVPAKPSARFEVVVVAPGGQKVTGGTVWLLGTPLSDGIHGSEGEAEFYLPAGCYEARAVVPGLGEGGLSGCVAEGGMFEGRVRLVAPDGSAGREGCSVTGCRPGLTCQADRSCR